MIIDKLVEKIKACRNHTVVGLDPRVEYIPQFLLNQAKQSNIHEAKAVSEAFLNFNKEIINNIYDIVPAVKPQIAFYEQYGAAGIQCFYDTCSYAKSKGLIVIGDVKRGDIGSTADSYAKYYLGKSEYSNETDLITVNPYLGTDSLEPFINACKSNSKGIFVLVKTSNKSSIDIQDLISDGKKIYEHTANLVVKLGSDYIGRWGYSFVGAVVGATFSKEAKLLRDIMKQSYFLVPGYGAQGGTASDVVDCFNEDGLGAIINSSRAIITAYKSDGYDKTHNEQDFGIAARDVAIKMRDDINCELKKVGKVAW